MVLLKPASLMEEHEVFRGDDGRRCHLAKTGCQARQGPVVEGPRQAHGNALITGLFPFHGFRRINIAPRV
jgi:hypothetical protein